jgi:hypothetical protein
MCTAVELLKCFQNADKSVIDFLEGETNLVRRLSAKQFRWLCKLSRRYSPKRADDFVELVVSYLSPPVGSRGKTYTNVLNALRAICRGQADRYVSRDCATTKGCRIHDAYAMKFRVYKSCPELSVLLAIRDKMSEREFLEATQHAGTKFIKMFRRYKREGVPESYHICSRRKPTSIVLEKWGHVHGKEVTVSGSDCVTFDVETVADVLPERKTTIEPPDDIDRTKPTPKDVANLKLLLELCGTETEKHCVALCQQHGPEFTAGMMGMSLSNILQIWSNVAGKAEVINWLREIGNR